MSEHNERRYGDTIECSKCGKQWDKDDKEPPKCTVDHIKELREKFNLK